MSWGPGLLVKYLYFKAPQTVLMLSQGSEPHTALSENFAGVAFAERPLAGIIENVD